MSQTRDILRRQGLGHGVFRLDARQYRFHVWCCHAKLGREVLVSCFRDGSRWYLRKFWGSVICCGRFKKAGEAIDRYFVSERHGRRP